jgi:hypothetical protein
LARASDAQLRIGESIATKLRLGHDGAAVISNIDISGYGFRARCFASPPNDALQTPASDSLRRRPAAQRHGKIRKPTLRNTFAPLAAADTIQAPSSFRGGATRRAQMRNCASDKPTAVIAARLPPLSFRGAPLGASPESIATKLRLGHDGARVMFKSGSGGYGFRARCFASPRNDGRGDSGLGA